jgi:DNA repair exonuclease SbcCD ATPase subunit
MNVATVESLRITDFCCFKEVYVDLRRAGLVHVTGKNGDGKSALFRAICWCLFGKTVDGDDGDKVIRYGTKRAIVEMVVEAEDWSRWMMRRTRSKGAPGFSLYSLEKRDPEGNLRAQSVPAEGVGGTKDEVAARVCSILGMDFEGFRNSALYSQGDAARFSNPSVTDAQRKAVLHRMLSTDVLAVCHKWVLKQAAECQAKVDAVERALAVERARGAALDPDGAAEDARQWDADRDADVERLLGLARAAKVAADEAGDPVDVGPLRVAADRATETLVTREVDADEMAEVAQALAAEAEPLRVEMDQAAERLRAFQAVVAKLRTAECPTCSAPLRSGAGLERVKAAQADALRAERAHAEASRAWQAAKVAADRSASAWSDAKTVVVDARLSERAARDELNAALAAGAKRDPLLAKARGLLDQAKAKRAEENPHTGRAKELAEKKRASDDLVMVHEIDLHVLRKRAAHLAFWVKGFSNQGLPSYVLDSTMGFLTDRANHYLGWLSEPGRRISVEFRTQRELASKKGEVRDEIAVIPSVNGREGYALSHGQQKRLDLASGFALMDLAASGGGEIGLLQLDEVLDGLDEGGRACAVSLLKDLRVRKPSVLVISHEQDIGEAFESRWQVIMDACGVSTVEVT